MKVWIVSVGEPLPSDGENVRLRRMGNLAQYIATNETDSVDWFSVSFDHYKKKQRVQEDTVLPLKPNYRMHLLWANGYKRNISVARIRHHHMGAKRIFRELERLAKAGDTPDVIVASMEPLEMSSVSVKFAKKYNIPIVVDVRDLWPEIYYEVIPQKLHFLLDIYVRYCAGSLGKTMSGATSIVGLSEDFLQYGLKYARREKQEKDAVIPIGYPNYDYSAYKGNFRHLKERFGIEPDDFIVTFLGNFGNQFDFAPIVAAAQALKAHKDIKFVLCGTGIQMESLQEQVADCSVIFPGWIEKEDIATLTANSHLGLAPYIDSQNYQKNTPNKFGEYLSASLPPILGVGGLMEKLVTEHECGRVYHNGEELTRIVQAFYEDRQLLDRFAKNARALYEARFNAERINAVFYRHLRELAKEDVKNEVV